MTDELNPYPGNLRHIKVDATAEELFANRPDWLLNSHDRDIAEYWIDELQAARAKDAELIQRLVDGLKHAQRFAEEYGYGPLQTVEWDLEAAAAAGFKPSNE